MKAIGKKAEEVGKNAASAIAEGSAKVADKVKDHLNQKQPTLDDVKDAIKNMANQVADSSAKVVDTIKNEIEKAANSDEVKKVLEAAQEKIDVAATEVEGGLKQVGNKLNEIFDFVKDEQKRLSQNPPNLDELKQIIIGMGGEIADGSSLVFEKIKEKVLNAANIEEIMKIITAAQEKVDKAATDVEGGLYDVADKLEEMLESVQKQNNWCDSEKQ